MVIDIAKLIGLLQLMKYQEGNILLIFDHHDNGYYCEVVI